MTAVITRQPAGGEPAASSMAPELVTVIIPAYNADLTIGDTLASVQAQTHANLEVLVIDDGSTDDTAAIVLRHAALDRRIRLIRQRNGGVAAARNRGIAEARGEYIAPIDADDLWRPAKIAAQLEALRSGGERVALVYCWYALIDEKSRVINLRHRPTEEGDVLAAMCVGNLVGNGSAALMRRSVLREIGGYDPSLRARSAQGCEDLKLNLQIAARYHFAVVRAHLTGYRRTSRSMSSDVTQMIRSFDLVADEFRALYPQFSRQFHQGRNDVLRWLLTTALRLGRFSDARALVRIMLAHDAHRAMLILAAMPALLTRSALVPQVRWLSSLARRPRRSDSVHFLGGDIVLPVSAAE